MVELDHQTTGKKCGYQKCCCTGSVRIAMNRNESVANMSFLGRSSGLPKNQENLEGGTSTIFLDGKSDIDHFELQLSLSSSYEHQQEVSLNLMA